MQTYDWESFQEPMSMTAKLGWDVMSGRRDASWEASSDQMDSAVDLPLMSFAIIASEGQVIGCRYRCI